MDEVMRLARLTCGALLLLTPLACTPPSVEPPPEKSAAPSGPPARVDLPPMIKLEGSIPPETHADHTMRIDGLLARRDKYLKQKVLVRGFLVDTYAECPKDAKKCERPHIWLADSPAGGEKRLMVVALDEEKVKALEVGEQYVVTGRFEQKSGDGFVRSEGLLVHESIEGLAEMGEGDDKR